MGEVHQVGWLCRVQVAGRIVDEACKWSGYDGEAGGDMVVTPWGRDDDRINNDDIGALWLMEFFVLCGVATHWRELRVWFWHLHWRSLRAAKIAMCAN